MFAGHFRAYQGEWSSRPSVQKTSGEQASNWSKQLYLPSIRQAPCVSDLVSREAPLHSSSRSVGLHCPTLNTTSFSREIFYAIQNSKESLLNNRLTSYERIFNRLYDKLECDVYYYCVCRPTTCNMSFNVHQSFPRKKPNKHWRFSFNYLRHSSP